MNDRAQRLAAARLYVCTDARRTSNDLVDFVERAVGGGVDIVQIRDKTLTTAEELEVIEQVHPVCERVGALFAVNDRADVAIASQSDILHVGQDDLPIATARGLVGPKMLIGRSTHSLAQARVAEADADVDYFCVGPVWETPTKPGRPAAGLSTLREVAETSPETPWFAIGGIDEDRLPAVVDSGATRIVVVRAITQATDPEAAARRLRDRLP